MQKPRTWLIPLCLPLVLAFGGCPMDSAETLVDSVSEAANTVLEQVATEDVTAPPTETDIDDLAGMLGLTDDQQQQAQGIYQAVRGDFSDLRSAAVKDIRTAMTTAQRKLLDEVARELLDQAGLSESQKVAVQPMVDLLASRVGLSGDQQGQIAATRASLSLMATQLRAQARAALVEMLTDTQASVLNQIGGI